MDFMDCWKTGIAFVIVKLPPNNLAHCAINPATLNFVAKSNNGSASTMVAPELPVYMYYSE
jgi:hypothetical protein